MPIRAAKTSGFTIGLRNVGFRTDTGAADGICRRAGVSKCAIKSPGVEDGRPSTLAGGPWRRPVDIKLGRNYPRAPHDQGSGRAATNNCSPAPPACDWGIDGTDTTPDKIATQGDRCQLFRTTEITSCLRGDDNIGDDHDQA